jgi:hypothetical protein
MEPPWLMRVELPVHIVYVVMSKGHVDADRWQFSG